MSSEQEERAAGSVPNAYGNAVAWRWAPAMPTPLRRGFLTMLYALRSMANASGELRFHGDRKPIRIQDIAKAAGCREKDARRYLNAAIAAGIVAVRGERRRGTPTLYVLALLPSPDWDAALASLSGSKEAPGKTPPPWRAGEESSGDHRPNQFGPPPPEPTDGTAEEVRATAARSSSGDHRPFGSGPRRPNNPGIAKELPQEMAEVGGQPQVDRAPGDPAAADKPPPEPGRPGWTRCANPACRAPIIQRIGQPPRTHCHACDPAQGATA